MQTTMRRPATSSGSRLVANLIGVVIVALVVATLTNVSVPLLGSERCTFVAVVLLGITMCSLGGVGRAPRKYGWMHPVTVFGTAVGTIMLLLAAAVMLGQV